MAREVNPQDTDRAAAFALWMQAPNPMVTLFKTLDVTHLVRVSKRRGLRFHPLLCYCIGKAASEIPQFYTLPVGEQLMEYDRLAVNTIVKTRTGDISSCDVLFSENLDTFYGDYLRSTTQVAESCQDIDLSDACMVIGTSAITDTELDGVIGMYSGLYNNPFLFWGRYRKRLLRCTLPVSFQFHHTQMDGAHAGRFLEALQTEIDRLR